MPQRVNDLKVSTDFALYEYECPCCHAVTLHPKLAACCQRLRDRIGQPITVLSAYRCTAHNVEVGGLPDSFHREGMAVDLDCGPMPKRDLAVICLTIFPRVGLYWRKRADGMKYLVLHCDVADPITTGLPAKFGDAWDV